jgi:hypothetical protein
MAELRPPPEGITLTHFIVSEDVERSRRVYTEVLGGTVAFSGPGGLTYVALSNSWSIINGGGGPTDDKPSVTLEDKWQPDELVAVPYFDGLMTGEPDALVGSFAAEPEVHDPVRGRVKGTRAFKAFVTDLNAWIARRNVSVEDVEHVVTERRGFEEVVLHLDSETGRVDLPLAIVADREPDGRIAADLLQQLATDRGPREPSAAATARP